MKRIKTCVLTVLILIAMGCTNDSDSDLLNNTPENELVTYTETIKSIMDQKCNNCHGAVFTNGAPMSLHTFETVKNAVINRGLIDRITRTEGQSGFMPIGAAKLPQTQIDQIIQWQNEGFPL